jgi:plastocyanin
MSNEKHGGFTTMRKCLVPTFAFLLLALPAVASGANQTVSALGGNTFSPSTVTINQGDTVTWNNVSGSHNVKFDDGSFEMPPSPSTALWSVSRTFPNVGTTMRYYCEAHGAPNGVGMSGVVNVNVVLYPRPGSASPLRVSLVPEYRQCTTPNSTHVTPLNLASCNPAQEQSALLTTAPPGSGSGFVKMTSLPGVPGGADDADINISSTTTSVRRRSDGTAYTGRAILHTAIRLTDMANGPGVNSSGTAQDAQFSLPVDCTSGTCGLNTTADTLVPNFAREGKRTIIDSLSVNLKDAGADGSIGAASCAPNCGTGDEQIFMRQGVFLP